MGRTLQVQSEAQRDIEAAALWYEHQRPGLGVRFVRELDELLERVAERPQQFPIVEESVHRGLLGRFPYAIYFVAEETRVTLLAVLHQHRSPEIWRGRL